MRTHSPCSSRDWPPGNGTDPHRLPLAAATCLRRLQHLGAGARVAAGDPDGGAVRIVVDAPRRVPDGAGGPGRVECDISSYGPVPYLPRSGGESVIQALSGLMAANGRDQGQPEPIGLEVASVAAGVLATHGVLALLIGASRGAPARIVRTCLLQAAVLLCSHYVAAATGQEDPAPRGVEPAPGPPFQSADGTWFEIETLDPEAWRSFWRGIGAPDHVLGRAWTRFRPRYFAGACTLPPGLHEATRRHSLAELSAVAVACGVSLLPLRAYDGVLADLGDWRGTPPIQPFVPDAGPAPVPGAKGGQARGPLPLTGLVVVEATTRMQGPLASHLLRMLGASVVKVEPPGGDIGRMVPPMAGDVGTFFQCFNRGKRPVELDLTTRSGQADLVDLVRGADVFLQNWRPGRDRQWSLTPGDLAARNPALIYARASGWGGRRELDGVLGMDFLVQAFAGLGYGLRPVDEPPRTSRLTLTDFMGALVTCEGILAALYERCQDGRGRLVDSSLLAGGLTLEAHVLDGLRAGRENGRKAGRPVWGVLDRPIETADAALVVDQAVGLPRLLEACGLDGDPGEPGAARMVAARIAAGSAGGWRARLAQAGIASAVVRDNLAALPSDPVVGGLFESLGGGSYAAASPWAFAC